MSTVHNSTAAPRRGREGPRGGGRKEADRRAERIGTRLTESRTRYQGRRPAAGGAQYAEEPTTVHNDTHDPEGQAPHLPLTPGPRHVLYYPARLQVGPLRDLDALPAATR